MRFDEINVSWFCVYWMTTPLHPLPIATLGWGVSFFVFLNLHLYTQNTNTIFVNIGWHDNPPTSTRLQPWVERSYRIKFHYLINFMTGSTSTFVIVFQFWTISINKSPIFHIAMLTPQKVRKDAHNLFVKYRKDPHFIFIWKLFFLMLTLSEERLLWHRIVVTNMLWTKTIVTNMIVTKISVTQNNCDKYFCDNNYCKKIII